MFGSFSRAGRRREITHQEKQGADDHPADPPKPAGAEAQHLLHVAAELGDACNQPGGREADHYERTRPARSLRERSGSDMSREGLRAPIWSESGTEGLVPKWHFRASKFFLRRVGRAGGLWGET